MRNVINESEVLEKVNQRFTLFELDIRKMHVNSPAISRSVVALLFVSVSVSCK